MAPFGPFTTIANIGDKGDARYDSLQFKAETKSVRHGLYALVGYTYARNFDSGFPDGVGTSSGATYYPLPNTRKADWALSQLQLNHNFTASVIYDLPFGKGKHFGSTWNSGVNAVLGNWEVDVIEKITSGFPVFIDNSNNGSGSTISSGGTTFNRPIRSAIRTRAIKRSRRGSIFRASCAARAGKLGNASRTPLYGPGFVNTDFSAIKHFPLPWREGMMVDFRAEFFNIFNHPQFFTPGADISSFGFGAITQTVNNPRLVQFALKLRF